MRQRMMSRAWETEEAAATAALRRGETRKIVISAPFCKGRIPTFSFFRTLRCPSGLAERDRVWDWFVRLS